MPIAISDFMVSPINKDVLTRMNAITMDVAAANARQAPDIFVYHSFEPIEADWLMLESARHVSPHQSLAWCKAWAGGRELAIVVGRHRGRVLFILPLEIVATELGRIARFIGAAHSNINTGLFHESFATTVERSDIRAIFATVRRQLAGRADLIQLANMPQTWRNVRMPWLLQGAVENQNCAYQLPLRATMEDTLSQVNAKSKRKLFRRSVKFFDQVGGYEHIVAKTREDKLALLDLFFQQKAERLQSLRLPNPFRDHETQAAFKAAVLSEQTDTSYPLQMNALRLKNAEGTIAAIAGVSRKGDHLICQFSSVDANAVPCASPGEFLFYLMIEKACGTRAALFDFGIGYQLYKRNWCPVETPHFDLLLPVSLRGRLSSLAMSAATRLKAAVKRHRSLYTAIQSMRAGKQA